ncbi:MAG: hypothetical protein GY778_25295 [bacterium]|nr:hypothetical protein [bacterium]
MDLDKRTATLSPGTTRRTCRRRGSMYVVVLGTAMMVTIIGLSALYVVRVEHRSGQGSNDRLEAQLYARSGIERGFLMIRTDPDWRNTLGSGSWAAEQPIGNGSYTLVALITDDGDGLPDNDPVVLTATGISGRASHATQVTVVPQNGGMVVSPGSWQQGTVTKGG